MTTEAQTGKMNMAEYGQVLGSGYAGESALNLSAPVRQALANAAGPQAGAAETQRQESAQQEAEFRTKYRPLVHALQAQESKIASFVATSISNDGNPNGVTFQYQNDGTGDLQIHMSIPRTTSRSEFPQGRGHLHDEITVMVDIDNGEMRVRVLEGYIGGLDHDREKMRSPLDQSKIASVRAFFETILRPAMKEPPAFDPALAVRRVLQAS